jgi:hypothetical protein
MQSNCPKGRCLPPKRGSLIFVLLKDDRAVIEMWLPREIERTHRNQSLGIYVYKLEVTT